MRSLGDGNQREMETLGDEDQEKGSVESGICGYMGRQ